MQAKPVKAVKIILYILMSVLIVVNSSTSELTGVLVHLISGTAFCILFAIHIFLSRKFFIASCKNFFNRKIKMKMRVNIIVDFLMIFLFAAIAATGILLANDIIPDGFAERHDFELLHGLFAAMAFMLLVIHICMHVNLKRKNNNRNFRGQRK